MLVLVTVSVVTFALLHFAPGGPAVLMSADLSPEDAARMRENLGLDDPFHVRYVKWISAVMRGDFGVSLMGGRPVGELIGERLPNTLVLSAAALLIAVVFGLTGGAISALKRGSIWDHLIGLLTVIGISAPLFWLAIMVILLFAVRLRVLPSSGMGPVGEEQNLGTLLRHLILPSSVLATTFMARFARFTRSGLLEVLGKDYVRTARAKGLAERTVVMRHALRNALIPVVTIIGLALPVLFGGAAIAETIFGWPGMGRLAVDAAFQRDYPVVMGVTLMISAVVIVSNLVVDILYSYLDPRVKFG